MKNILSICIIVYLFSSTLFAQSNKIEIDEKIQKVNDLLDKSSISDEMVNILLQAEKDSKEINYSQGILESEKSLARLYLDISNYKTSLKFCNKAEKIAIELEDSKSLSQIYRHRALTFMNLGFLQQGHKDIMSSIDNSKKIEDKNLQHYCMALSYHNLAEYYEKTQASQDTILSCLKKSLKAVENIKGDIKLLEKKHFMIILLNKSLGMFYTGIHEPQRLDLASQYILELLKYRETQPKAFRMDELNTLNSIGRFYDAKKEPEKAIKYASEVLFLEKKSKSPFERHLAYATLANSYESIGDKNLSNQYLSLYSTLVDSINKEEKRSIELPMEHIISDKEESFSKTIGDLLLIIGSIILILLLAGWLLWKRQNRILQKKHKKVIEELIAKKNTLLLREEEATNLIDNDNPTQRSLNIRDKTVESLLLKLEKFEKSKKFIKNEVSLTWLANYMNTNTKSLSEIIRQYKEESFNDYINKLRIKYIVELLYDEPKHREYKISYLAEICGFSSREVFTTVFKKETGISPSYFINNLKKDLDIKSSDVVEYQE
ncbi:AraC-like DNA-binding protein [Flavobacterium arsenatis]|uniref:AraC-like DNA-binding protein n=1 Tax=Flavobacterium arsenatis TaxID=1484332 RepID=A0ABU1TMY5_9FLAO|nr:helix-turn-helix transcriptional regulator [Flavobacterium arsenatis]MDR6967330.1 AraC-like DNA-binding protein [Flavobacterium arsenatis]